MPSASFCQGQYRSDRKDDFTSSCMSVVEETSGRTIVGTIESLTEARALKEDISLLHNINKLLSFVKDISPAK